MAGKSWWASEKWRIIRTILMAVGFQLVLRPVLHDRWLTDFAALAAAVAIDCTIYYFELRRQSYRKALRYQAELRQLAETQQEAAQPEAEPAEAPEHQPPTTTRSP